VKDLRCEYYQVFHSVTYNIICSILRPNTPYRVLAVQHTICAGGVFYSTSNLTESCIGVLQSFVSTSDKSFFRASRLLLSRILIYIHQQFVLEGFTPTSPNSGLGHLPDLETMEGVLGVLSLINIAELANVLHPDTYQAGVDPTERMFLIHVRKLGRHLLRWLNSHYSVEPVYTPGALISATQDVPQLWQLYLFHQARALQDVKESMDQAQLTSSIPGLTYQALSVQIAGCLGPHVNQIQERVNTFAWEGGTHQVSRRRTNLPFKFSMFSFLYFSTSF
jgi:hypothetical protein